MILGLDTSTSRLSLALGAENRIIADKQLTMAKRHNESLLPVLQELLQQQQATPADLSAIVVGLGPGSFTGVRVGVAAALGLAQALDRPVVGISSFLTIAVASPSRRVLVTEDARQGMYYAAGYQQTEQGWQAFLTEQLVDLQQLAAVLPDEEIELSGSGAAAVIQELSLKHSRLHLGAEENCWPQAQRLIQLATGQIKSQAQVWLEQGGMPWEELTPIYLRRTQAEEQQSKRGGKA